MWEISGSLIYSVAKDLWKRLRGHRRRLSKPEILALRAKWQDEIQQKLWDRKTQGILGDVIIRDVARLDMYAEVRPSAGISAWFKAGIAGTYHRGILVGLNYWEMNQNSDGVWRRHIPEIDSNFELTCLLIGKIRYENIEMINWEGDEYYSDPHIYCHFVERKGQPYEGLYYGERVEMGNGHIYFREIEEYEKAKKASKAARKISLWSNMLKSFRLILGR